MKKRGIKISQNPSIYQFKIKLKGIKPPIWRRIRLRGDYTFDVFHRAIIKSVGWDGYHQHSFIMTDPGTGTEIMIHPSTPEGDWGFGPVSRMEEEHEISEYFTEDNNECLYEYDFGDSWKHLITCEKIVEAEESDPEPQLLDGERACPPEDVGGVPGYMGFLEAIEDPDHPEHERWLRWIVGDFDPEDFDPEEIDFS